MLDGVDNVLSNRAVIEDLGPLLCDQTVGVRQVRVAEQRPHGRCRTGRRQKERARRRKVLKPAQVLIDLQIESRIDNEALVGDLDRRLEKRRKWPRAELLGGNLPGLQCPGHADAEAAGHQFGKRDRLPGRRIDEDIRTKRFGRGLARVDRGDAVMTGVVDHHEATATDAG